MAQEDHKKEKPLEEKVEVDKPEDPAKGTNDSHSQYISSSSETSSTPLLTSYTKMRRYRRYDFYSDR